MIFLSYLYLLAGCVVAGKNNCIKVIKRVAYGYRNHYNFRQRILLANRK